MNLEEKYTLIEKYLAEEMQGEELHDFEKKLLNDSDLKEELNLHQQVAETLKGEKIHQLRSVLNDIDKKWETPSKQKPAKVINFNFRRILTIAAAIALLITGYQLFTNSNLSSEELYAANFETYPMLLNQRDIDPTINIKAYSNAITFYLNGQNQEAIVAFDQLIKLEPDNNTYEFYKGNLLLAENKSDEAIPIFQKIINGNHPLLVEQTRWYLALAFLKQNDQENAKALLEEIKPGRYKSKEAAKILKQL